MIAIARAVRRKKLKPRSKRLLEIERLSDGLGLLSEALLVITAELGRELRSERFYRRGHIIIADGQTHEHAVDPAPVVEVSQ